MQGRLYLHVGPPKTATTALQYCLQDGLDDVLLYGGVSQPRGQRHGELSGRLHQASSGGGSPLNTSGLRAEIESVLQDGRHLVVSEEMFLVDQGKFAHQRKIRELARIVEIFSPRVLVGVRNPVAGLRSLYQELYHSLPLQQRLSFSKFLSSNQAKVFDYDHLCRLLSESGLRDIGLISFDRFVSNEVWLGDVVEISADQDRRLVPKTVNRGAVDTSGKREFRAITLSDLGQKVAARVPGADALGEIVLRSRLAGQLWDSVKLLRVWKDSSRELTFPSRLEEDLGEKFERVMLSGKAPNEQSRRENERV